MFSKAFIVYTQPAFDTNIVVTLLITTDESLSRSDSISADDTIQSLRSPRVIKRIFHLMILGTFFVCLQIETIDYNGALHRLSVKRARAGAFVEEKDILRVWGRIEDLTQFGFITLSNRSLVRIWNVEEVVTFESIILIWQLPERDNGIFFACCHGLDSIIIMWVYLGNLGVLQGRDAGDFVNFSSFSYIPTSHRLLNLVLLIQGGFVIFFKFAL